MAGVIFCADSGALRGLFRWINSVPFGDKVGHVFLIGIMAHLLNRALAGRCLRVSKTRWQMGGLIVAVLMTIEEFTQIWIPSRTFDWGDLLANYAGVIVAEWLARRAAAQSSLANDASTKP